MTAKNFVTVFFTKDIQDRYSKNFDCGNPALTAFLKNYDALDISFGKTYVMLKGNDIVGYYNISAGCIDTENSIRMGGSVYINCLAVDKRYQKIKCGERYISDALLADCLNRTIDLRENVLGFAFVTLASTDEGYNLYERNGFFPLEDDMKISKNMSEKTCIPMYFPLDYE